MAMTILYVTAVAVFFNYTENDRLRAPVDPYYLVLSAFFAWRLTRFVRERREPS
jgi:hypothetical protein